MATSTQTQVMEVTERVKTAKTVMGGSLAEGIVGGATVVLALLGLSSIYPSLMLPIATITMGAAFLFEGGAISTRFSRLFAKPARIVWTRRRSAPASPPSFSAV
ncbi:MAG: hypothetical protein ABSA46_12365 [Thermodesulfovibrionales bacterium]